MVPSKDRGGEEGLTDKEYERAGIIFTAVVMAILVGCTCGGMAMLILQGIGGG
jgi:hypothetical protein